MSVQAMSSAEKIFMTLRSSWAALEFAREEGVQVFEVTADGLVDFGVVDLGDGLEEDAVGRGSFLADHGVVADEAAEALGGVAGVGEALLPVGESLLGGALDEGDEKIALGVEVAVDDGLGDAGGAGQLGGGRAGIAALCEEVRGTVQQLLRARFSAGRRLIQGP